MRERDGFPSRPSADHVRHGIGKTGFTSTDRGLVRGSPAHAPDDRVEWNSSASRFAMFVGVTPLLHRSISDGDPKLSTLKPLL